MKDEKSEDDQMTAGMSAAARATLHTRLREMPDTVPPRAVWQRIEEQARAEGLFRPVHAIERLKWIAGPAIAATVAVIALGVPFREQPAITTEPETFGTEPATMQSGGPLDLNALKVESQTLERNLRLLPQHPSVMKVSTATTIRELEEQIAAIDYRLNDRTIKLEPKQQEIYWRERVRLMNLLVNLRYAQAHRMSF
jgi:hypothetical protein